jgi:hypothetical protein
MKPREMVFRVLAFSLLFSICAFAPAQSLRASPPIGVVVQTWHYDPTTKVVTIRLVNTTQKDILAWNLSITETFADGSTSNHEVMTDLLDRMLTAQQAKGTVEEARITQRFGNGTFAAGAGFDQNIPEPKAVTNMQIVVDMVAYADRTADVQNEKAFAQVIAYRQGELLALQQANEVIQQALSGPNASEAAATELKRRFNVVRAQNFADGDPQSYEASHFQAAISSLQNAGRLSSTQQTEYLKKDVVMRQQRIALAEPHAQLTKMKGEGQ